jgi:hypothetical protein
MIHKYLQIVITGENAGTVLNTILMDDNDYFDSRFKWIKLEPDAHHPGIGHTVVIDPVEVKTGDQETFAPFQLSSASGAFHVSFDGLNINMDCRKFNMKWLRNELTMLHRHKKNRGTLTIASREGVLYEEYCITWEDIERILSAMETLK